MGNIGKNIRDLRIQKNMTQDDLAEKLYVTRQTVSNYETGKTLPNVEMLVKISELLDVDISQLLNGPIPLSQRRRDLACFLWGALLSLTLLLAGALLSSFGQEFFSVRGYAFKMLARLLPIPGGYLAAGWSLLQLLGMYTVLRPLSQPQSLIIRRTVLVLLAIGLLTVLPFSVYLLWTVADYWLAKWQGVEHYSHQSSFPMLPVQMFLVETILNHGAIFSLFGALLWLCGFPSKRQKASISRK